jgi:hypothetical protein
MFIKGTAMATSTLMGQGRPGDPEDLKAPPYQALGVQSGSARSPKFPIYLDADLLFGLLSSMETRPPARNIFSLPSTQAQCNQQ